MYGFFGSSWNVKCCIQKISVDGYQAIFTGNGMLKLHYKRSKGKQFWNITLKMHREYSQKSDEQWGYWF